MVTLSQKDQLVLGALFDSESSPSTAAPIDPTSTPSLPGISTTTLLSLQDQETEAIRPLSSDSPPRVAIEAAITQLTALITDHPTYASAYNNRAQAVRLLVGDDLTSSAASQSTISSDLSRACELAAPSSPNTAVSALQAKILASAHTHRGHLLLRASRTMAAAPEKTDDLPAELRGADREALERMAAREFQLGGRFGNAVARQMAVQLNPYAKMCGEIVREAIQGDIREFYKGTAVVMGE